MTGRRWRWLVCAEAEMTWPVDMLFSQHATACRCMLVADSERRVVLVPVSGSGLYRLACDAVAWAVQPLERVDVNIVASVLATVQAARVLAPHYDVATNPRALLDTCVPADGVRLLRRRAQRLRGIERAIRRRIALSTVPPVDLVIALDTLQAAKTLAMPLHPWTIARRVGALAVTIARTAGRAPESVTADLVERLARASSQPLVIREMFGVLITPTMEERR